MRAVLIIVAGIALLLLLAWVYRNKLHDLVVDDTKFEREIRLAAIRYDLEPALVRAVVFQESRFNPKTRGSKGEVGLMQVLPSGAVSEWAKSRRVASPRATQLYDPVLNLEIGCWYLSRAMQRWSAYRFQTELALAQYNAGASRVVRWKPPTIDGELEDRIDIESTKLYVRQVMTRYRKYRESMR